MTLKKYMETVKEYVEDKDRVFHALCLVSDTANLLEKLKYFKKENTLVMSEIGEAIFRATALMGKLDIVLDSIPLDLEALKMQTDSLDSKYQISEYDLLQNITMELGFISNIITENMKYDIIEYTANDVKRLKDSIFSYILFMLILVCKFNFSIDKVLEFNVKQLKASNIKLNARNIQE